MGRKSANRIAYVTSNGRSKCGGATSYVYAATPKQVQYVYANDDDDFDVDVAVDVDDDGVADVLIDVEDNGKKKKYCKGGRNGYQNFDVDVAVDVDDDGEADVLIDVQDNGKNQRYANYITAYNNAKKKKKWCGKNKNRVVIDNNPCDGIVFNQVCEFKCENCVDDVHDLYVFDSADCVRRNIHTLVQACPTQQIIHHPTLTLATAPPKAPKCPRKQCIDGREYTLSQVSNGNNSYATTYNRLFLSGNGNCKRSCNVGLY